jgi:hypothetical protein
VSEIGGQVGQMQLDILIIPIPFEQGLDGETVAEIMNVRATMIRWLTQPDLVTQVDEPFMHSDIDQRFALFRDEEI